MKKLLRHFLSAALLLPAFGFVTAQTIPSPLADKLQHALDSMHLVLNNKGMGAAVQIPSGAVWAGGTGVSAEDPLVPIDTNQVFGIGSVTKTLTAACILQLADEGVLSLDDSLHEWLDTFPNINPNITIRQLLRHQSGIYNFVEHPDFSPFIEAYPDSTWAWDDVVRTFTLAPLFQPGASWSYCNTNYLLLGLIIEHATGHPYYQECRNRFWNPLGLESIVIPPYEAFPPDVAHVWLDLTGDNVVDDADIYFSDWNAWYSTAGAAGAYFSTPADMARWMRTYMSGALLSPAMMLELKKTVTTPMSGGTKYGLGMMERNILNYKAFGHGGDAGYSASVWYFPAKDISISVLNNDGKKNSWTLIPTVMALLKTYLNFEQQLSASKDLQPEMLEITASPNPFSATLNVSLTLPAGVAEARMLLTNTLGETVAEAVPTTVGGSEAVFQFDGLSGLPSGVYMLNSVLNGKMAPVRKVLLKAG